ncbi:MAG: YIP1 family protein [Acidobacteriota bacterium]|nr:YIP1 family protein [Acidobacteriota bacterium]
MNETNQTEWQAPPIPEEIKKTDEAPKMSEASTLGNIFFSPGETFEDLRRKPRFLLASLIIVIAASLFQIAFIEKLGSERIARERIESSPMTRQMSAEDKQKSIEQQSQPAVKYLTYAAIQLALLISIFVGGLIYWLGASAMGGTMTFMRGVSVWAYSSFPPMIVSMLANILVLFLKSADDIDIAASQSGLVQANPSFFIDTKTMPVLGAVLGTFDLFFIWGWILAAIGLSVVGKISKGAAWAVVLVVALLNVAFRVIGAIFS